MNSLIIAPINIALKFQQLPFYQQLPPQRLKIFIQIVFVFYSIVLTLACLLDIMNRTVMELGEKKLVKSRCRLCPI